MIELETIAISDISVGMAAAIEFVVSQQDMETFARLSGDRNPLHMDAEFAKQRGFKGPVVYGALIVAKLSAMIGMRLPGKNALWCGVKINFREPLFVGEIARLEAKVSSFSEVVGLLQIDVNVLRGESVLAYGKAEVRLRDA